MTRGVWQALWLLLIGRRLAASVDRNAKAADELDAVLKEVLKR